jgi:hypothetical protein
MIAERLASFITRKPYIMRHAVTSPAKGPLPAGGWLAGLLESGLEP